MKDLISIIVPIYNVEQYLPKCLNSIINQTYKNIEIILIDDGSVDNSGKVCDEYSKKDNRIKVIHQKNSGVSCARNMGIDTSKGEWITFVDADDWIELNFCEEMLNSAKKNNSNYVVCGYKRVYKKYSEIINIDRFEETFDYKIFLHRLLNVQYGFGFCHMKLINRKIIEKIRFNPNLKVGEDALFNIKLSKKVIGSFVNKPLYNYNFNSNSVVRKFDNLYIDKYLLSMKETYSYVKKNYQSELSKSDIYNYIVYHVMLIAVNYCYNPKKENKLKSLIYLCNIDLFKESIKKSNYDGLSITRKITLFTIKYKLYLLTGFICIIRQRQFK